MAASGGMRLRPMGVGDILDETFRLYRRHFLSYVVLSAVVAVPVAVLSAAITIMVGTGSGLGRASGATGAMLAAGFVVSVPLGLIIALGYLLSGAAAVQLTAAAVLGKPVSARAAYRAALARFWPLLWTSLLAGLTCGLIGITIIGLPFAIYLGLGWTLVLSTVMLDGSSGRPALRRSSTLVKGNRWRVFAIVFLIGLLVWILESVPNGLVSLVAGMALMLTKGSAWATMSFQLVTMLTSAISQSLFGALAWIVPAILYFELRVRKEAFDLEQLADQAETLAGSVTGGG